MCEKVLTEDNCIYIVLCSLRGEVAEWLMAADCKSALLRVRWFESSPLHHFGKSLTDLVAGDSGMKQSGFLAGVAQW
jgi:hypothetical protein